LNHLLVEAVKNRSDSFFLLGVPCMCVSPLVKVLRSDIAGHFQLAASADISCIAAESTQWFGQLFVLHAGGRWRSGKTFDGGHPCESFISGWLLARPEYKASYRSASDGHR
jgi:hypothetical protein